MLDVQGSTSAPYVPSQDLTQLSFNNAQSISRLLFPTDFATKPVEYNATYSSNLDQVQTLLDNDLINEDSFNFHITNEKQFTDINDWLSSLSSQIPPQAPAPVSTLAAHSQSSIYSSQQNNYSTQCSMLQSQNGMYPISCEENDFYDRSQPNPQPVVPSQDIKAYLEQTPYMQPAYHQTMGLAGQRRHYIAVPNVSSSRFCPEVRKAYNFTNANSTESEGQETPKSTKSSTCQTEKVAVSPKNSSITKAKALQIEKKKDKDITTIQELVTLGLSKLSLNDTNSVTKNDKNTALDTAKSLSSKTTIKHVKQQAMSQPAIKIDVSS